MIEPWDIPLLPTRGDTDPEITHAARSRAIDAWEYVELSLFMLDGIFREKIVTEYRYGSGIIFKQRINLLVKNSCKFFKKNPSQENEGDFSHLVYQLDKYSMRRHDIAHGIVQIWPTKHDSMEFALMPGFYQVERPRITSMPSYVYNSETLKKFTESFHSLRQNIIDFSDHLVNRAHQSSP